MKKLTENWKVKKNKAENRSFKDSIDFNLSTSVVKEVTNTSKLKLIPKNASVSKLQNSSYNDKDFSSVRRSIRLQNKASQNREMELDISSQENGESFQSSSSSVNINEPFTADDKHTSKENIDNLCSLSQWGLPPSIVEAYKSQNIDKMFQWQYECLCSKDVLEGRNLVFSAPTSAGKTLVAEILMLKKVTETRKKAIMILPFVSVVREKIHYFQEMFQNAGIVVDGYMGAHNPPGGFKAIDIAVCTIEKANNLVNRLMEEKRLNELGILVIDELHMLGDQGRGYLLELLLTKLLYNCKKNNIEVQIIGMSATLPNLNVLSTWLDAELYHTDFRPVPLLEIFKIGTVLYHAKTKTPLRDLKKTNVSFTKDVDHITYLSIETIIAGHGVLIFCPSKNWCENLATTIAKEIYNIGRPNAVLNNNPEYKIIGEKLREHLNGSQLNDIILQLKGSPAGLDSVLGLTVPFGVAFHHAGLTFDERDIVEGAFRQGESILVCKESERNAALTLVNSDLLPVKSCLLKSGSNSVHSSLKRALIEVIASGVACSQKEVLQYVSCTLLYASLVNEEEEMDRDVKNSIKKCIEYLVENDIIFKNEIITNDSNEVNYKPTRLGVAILASGFSPDDALRVLKELQLARRCFVLENDLHILYEVTPPYLSDQMGTLNWMHYLSLWEELPEEFKRVGELVGVQENFIGLGVQGKLNKNSHRFFHKLAVHQRFFATLALNDLIQEMPLSVVSEKYSCTRGILQSLQQTTSTFAGMLTVFCNRLGWHNLELLFASFQKRVHFGIQQELCDLVRLSTLNAQRARALYNAGFESISSIASAAPDELAIALCNVGSFESAKQLEGDLAEEVLQRSKAKRIRIAGKQGVDENEAAHFIIKEAQNFIEQELGVSKVSWKHLAVKKFQGGYESPSNQQENNARKSSESLSNKSIIDKSENSPVFDEYSKIVRNVFAKETSKTYAAASADLVAINVDESLGQDDKKDVLAVYQVNNSVNSVTENSTKIDLTEQFNISEGNTSIENVIIHTDKNNSTFEKNNSEENLLVQSEINGDHFYPNNPEQLNSFDIIKNNCSKLKEIKSAVDDSFNMVDDSHFSELLLSQTAETENLYYAESFFSNTDASHKFSSNPVDNHESLIKKPLSISDKASHLDTLFNESDVFKTDCFSEYLQNISHIKENNLVNTSKIKETKFTVHNDKSSINELSNICRTLLEKSKLNAHSTPIRYSKDEINVPSVSNSTNYFSKPINYSVSANYPCTHINNSIDKVSDQFLPCDEKRISIDETSGEIFDCDESFSQDCPNNKHNKEDSNNENSTTKKNLELLTETSGDIFDEEIFEDVKETHINSTPVIESCKSFKQQLAGSSKENDALNPYLAIKSTSKVDNNLSELNILFKVSSCEKVENQVEDASDAEKNKSIIGKNKNEDLEMDNKLHQLEEESQFWNSWKVSTEDLNLSSISQNAEFEKKNAISNNEANFDNCDDLTINSVDNSLFDSFTSDILPPSPTSNVNEKCVSIGKISKNLTLLKMKNLNLFENEKCMNAYEDVAKKNKTLLELSGAQNKINLNIKEVLDEDLCNILRKIAGMKKMSFSLACEKTLHNKCIGPRKSKKNTTKEHKSVVDQDIAVVGLAICYGFHVFYISLSDQVTEGDNLSYLPFSEKIKLLQDFLNNQIQCKTIVAYDMKSHYKMLWHSCGISLKRNCVDPSIAAWLLDPALGQQSLKLLSYNYLPDLVSVLEGFDNKGSLGLQYWSSVSGMQRASTEAFVAFHAMEKLFPILKNQQLHKVFTEVEMPSIVALAKMEQNGMGFNTNLAVKFQKELQKKQQDILDKAYEMAGRRFNILSAKEISRILYKELKLNPNGTLDSPSSHRRLAIGAPHNKRLPPELKTNKECLEKILHLHPLPKAVLDWRRLSFATTKVLMPLLRKNKYDSFFHMDRLYATCYLYTLTGRVNLHSPNLQFIPRDFNVNNTPDDISSEDEKSEDEYNCSEEEISQFGISLRNLFIPSKGNVLVSADYSQLELRILAHLSGEKKLIAALNSGEDVFKSIAANWKNISVESVSNEERQQAKKICYGMIYGMSSNTVCQQLNTTKDNAIIFMETFKNSYPGLNSYFQSVIKKCVENGYVSTLMQRRRYLPLINSKCKSEKAHAERQAVNTTIQGSAADLIKSAMIKIEENLAEKFPESSLPYSIQNPDVLSTKLKKNICRGGFLILQMHDELIYEVKEKDLKCVLKIVKNAMEKAIKLKVKLPVRVQIGTSWGEMKEES
ncbi:hypothetical protein CDAR_80911 [Caerostris darwini]|uniref:DNA polymerase theta n=1 Tax=Caerostris darwini TaxID=1538125 RepID=A0AAV4SAL2_9ARAC|nr:hypothetical protein CDAR_80911 [Caerostris darwini]